MVLQPGKMSGYLVKFILWNCVCRYNKDGSVGLQIRNHGDLPTRDEIVAKQKETEEALEEGELAL